MSTTANRQTRYQEGSIAKVKRVKGRPDVWVFRYRELQLDGSRVQRKQIIGNTDQYKDKSAAKAAAVNLRERVNADNVNQGRKKLRQLWGHFQVFELGLRKDQRDLHAGEFAAADEPIDQTGPDDFPDGDEKRSPTTVQLYLDNFRLYILPKWGEFFIDEVKAPAVEYWLKNLMGQEKITARGRERKKLSPSSKSKLRNQMSALYSHALRHEWCTGINPIKAVRQSSKRQKTPDFLTLSEMKGILDNISDALRKTAVLVAAVTGFRRPKCVGSVGAISTSRTSGSILAWV